MSISAKIREQLISNFRAELTEHVQTMNDGLLALEQSRVSGQGSELTVEQRQAILETVFRAAHSLKGAARAVNVTAIEQLAHSLEGVLEAMQQESMALTPELFTTCYRALDAIQAVQIAYEAGETTPPLEALAAMTDLEAFRTHPSDTAETAKSDKTVAAPTEPSTQAVATEPPHTVSPIAGSPGSDRTIRVSVNKLDTLMAQLSELLVTKIRAEQRRAQFHQAQEFVTRWQREWTAVRGAYGRLAHQKTIDSDGNGLSKDLSQVLGYVNITQERLREMNVWLSDLSRQYANDTMQMSLVIDSLEQEIKRVRLQPLSTITSSLGRMVRDLAQEANKEASLQIVGGETELDKQVLERIKDPLIHLLRNAIDHGIEPPEQRAASGKPRAGSISLTAEPLGQDVVICIADDGAGLDLEAIRRAAARQGQAHALSLTEAELVELIFSLGISTSPIITDISGRGVGLTIVRRNVEALRGRVTVDWTPGGGTTFTLILPLTLTSAQGLLVRVSGQVFAIQLNAIEHILSIRPQDVLSLEGREAIHYNGHPVTLVRLCDVLELPRTAIQSEEIDVPVVIVSAAERRVAFAVDELLDEQEMVIKGLGTQLQRVGGIAGATVVGSGEVVLILNEADLIKLAMRGTHQSVLEPAAGEIVPAQTYTPQRILIVDDSITTRTLEKNILEAVGYTVQLATNGEEALNTITTGGVPDLIVSDILMPHMTGFELTERLKSDERTAGVPVILVSSLDSPEDKAHGIEVGADAYIVKSHFDQGNLLETIEQLI